MASRRPMPPKTPSCRPNPAVAPIENSNVPTEAIATPKRVAAHTTSPRARASNVNRGPRPGSDNAATSQATDPMAHSSSSEGAPGRRRPLVGVAKASNGTTRMTPQTVFAHQRNANRRSGGPMTRTSPTRLMPASSRINGDFVLTWVQATPMSPITSLAEVTSRPIAVAAMRISTSW